MWLTPPRVAVLLCVALTTALACSVPGLAQGLLPNARPEATSIQAITADPAAFAGRTVTVVGQFRGRNVFADLSDEPHGVRDVFVLRAATAAIWVAGARPRGQGFDPDAEGRADLGRWLRVTGTVRRDRALAFIEATSIELAPSTSQSAGTIALPPPPLEIVFSAPTQGEADVRLQTRIRLQFSEDVSPASLKDQISLSYSKSDSVERGEAQPPPVPFTFTYSPGTRALEIVPTSPLERFREVAVELRPGISGTRGERLEGWTLRFTTGGSD